jgi:hypothetical protein
VRHCQPLEYFSRCDSRFWPKTSSYSREPLRGARIATKPLLRAPLNCRSIRSRYGTRRLRSESAAMRT